MPTYEYACKTCGEHLEVAQSFRDDPLTECPSCGGPLRKVFGSIGIAFKGSGFYKTDSRAASSASRSSSSSESSGSGSSGSASSSEKSGSSSTTSSESSGSTSSASAAAGASSSAAAS